MIFRSKSTRSAARAACRKTSSRRSRRFRCGVDAPSRHSASSAAVIATGRPARRPTTSRRRPIPRRTPRPARSPASVRAMSHAARRSAAPRRRKSEGTCRSASQAELVQTSAFRGARWRLTGIPPRTPGTAGSVPPNTALRVGILAFGIVAPPARERAALEEHGRPDPRSVVRREPHHVEDGRLRVLGWDESRDRTRESSQHRSN